MSDALTGEIHDSLASSREQADRILASAEQRARELRELAKETDRARAEARLDRLARLRAEIESHQERIETAFVEIVEAIALAAARLADVARQADFTPPAWPAGVRDALELRLTETREMTIRIGDAGPPAGSTIASIEQEPGRR